MYYIYFRIWIWLYYLTLPIWLYYCYFGNEYPFFLIAKGLFFVRFNDDNQYHYHPAVSPSRHVEFILVSHWVVAWCSVVKRLWTQFKVTVGWTECCIVKRPFLFPSCWTRFSILLSYGKAFSMTQDCLINSQKRIGQKYSQNP